MDRDPAGDQAGIACGGGLHYACRMLALPRGLRFHRLQPGLLLSFLALTAAAQENWPQFRGADARGIGTSDRLPLAWGPGTNVAWKARIPGRGWSSPVVWGKQVLLTTAVSEGEEEAPKKGLYFGGERPATQHRHRWLAISLDLESGKTNWSTELFAAVPSTPIHVKNSYASETPVTDGEHLYVLFGQIGLYCLDLEGKQVWKQELPPRKTAYGWGTSSSPVVHGDRVYVLSDNEEASFLAAYDKRTGKQVWKVDRDEHTNYSTPYVWRHPARTELVISGRNQVRGYDLEGKVLWHFKGMSSLAIPTPFEADGLLYLAAGYVGDKLTPNKPVYVLRPGAEGDLTLEEGRNESRHIAWMQPNAAPYNPSPLVYQGRLFVLWDFGFLNCRDARTGKEHYDKQRLKVEGTAGFTSSPWAYRGRIFCLSEDGDTYVVKAGDTYTLERVNPLGEMCMATPAIAGPRLLVRALEHVYCIQEP
ncbi:MAG TPA: serine/threonine protein kinase [Verrucomicrobiales bacterium]|nr:serine/threonine protein kinase [Verrucomicrobiales bacterium]